MKLLLMFKELPKVLHAIYLKVGKYEVISLYVYDKRKICLQLANIKVLEVKI